MRYNPGGYQGVPNQREFRAAATGRPLQWARSDRPAALAAYLNVAFRGMLTPAVRGALYPARRAATADPTPHAMSVSAWHRFSQEVRRGIAALQQSEHPLSDNAARMFSGMGVPQAGPPVVGAGGDDRPHGVNKLSGVLGNGEEMGIQPALRDGGCHDRPARSQAVHDLGRRAGAVETIVLGIGDQDHVKCALKSSSTCGLRSTGPK